MLNDKTKEAVKNFIAKLGIELPAKPVVKLEDVTLMDGTMLTVDAMEVGSPAMFTGADGIAIPAEGEYEYEGGTIVCAAGAVTEIKPKEVEKEKQPESPVAPSEEMAAILSRLDAVEKAYQSSLAAKTTLEAELAENKKAVVVALSAIEEINNTAVAVSLEASKGKPKIFKSYEEMSNHEKMLFNKGKL